MSPRSPSSGRAHAAPRSGRWRAVFVALAAVVLVAAAVTAYHLTRPGSPPHKDSTPATVSGRRVTSVTTANSTTSSTVPSTTTTTGVPGTSTPAPPAHGPITSPPLPAPGPGFNQGQVTAVGDSVMVDYETPLQQDIPGINVQAAVSEQWSAGEAQLQQLKSEGQLGAVVIVGLSTNGPISSTDFADMMSILAGASRVVFVTVHVDRPWQDPNNAVLAAGVQQYHNTVLAGWYDLATQNPGWLYSDGTHLPIDGPGAQALAGLIAAKA